MSQPRPKNPLDVLQSMINAILIETGKALRSAQKENGRPSTAATTRLRAMVPSTTDNFHQALDDIECEILRAKAVIFRDYEELRSKRLALENPEPIIEEPEPQAMEADMNGTSSTPADTTQDTSTPIKAEPRLVESPEKEAVLSEDTLKQETSEATNDMKGQNLTPPSSGNANGADSKPIGLGIDTDGAVDGPGPATAELQNSSIDSLFGPDDNNAGDSALDFGIMDFLTNTNTEGNDQSQNNQNNDFDLANFGSSTQDFNMPDLNTSADTNTNNNNSNDANKPNDDPFASLGNPGGDSMDLDLDLDMAGAGDSVFDDMFFVDETNNLGGGDMEHGEFDNAFFGLE
ncbi:uncharacterized protein LY89DRAFT_694405 [Mollisia scopiformis]|uniref:Uncharacterized protein n=1 Tax=Mollisia scopiformis TaxID=149040 RepID=A0A194XPI0_MOLSC|nr:uncharacterized protein LY89DRAFT_694405 [Mollisia scopiformis]KUJ21979.1 hypothetical protein LY89DRAFT_694405 [Mollisia scopiformis]